MPAPPEFAEAMELLRRADHPASALLLIAVEEFATAVAVSDGATRMRPRRFKRGDEFFLTVPTEPEVFRAIVDAAEGNENLEAVALAIIKTWLSENGYLR